MRHQAKKLGLKGLNLGSGLEFPGFAEQVGGEVAGIGFVVMQGEVAEAQAGVQVEDGELAIAAIADAMAAVNPGGGGRTGVLVRTGSWECGRVR